MLMSCWFTAQGAEPMQPQSEPEQGRW